MGYGAHMKIVNKSLKTVTTNISSQDCMYDNGSEGSNLSYFDNLKVNAFTTAPESGAGQYIEAKGSGSCFMSSSQFTLAIHGLGTTTNNLNFKDGDRDWSCSGQPDYINVNINNSGNQASITITINDPS